MTYSIALALSGFMFYSTAAQGGTRTMNAELLEDHVSKGSIGEYQKNMLARVHRKRQKPGHAIVHRISEARKDTVSELEGEDDKPKLMGTPQRKKLKMQQAKVKSVLEEQKQNKRYTKEEEDELSRLFAAHKQKTASASAGSTSSFHFHLLGFFLFLAVAVRLLLFIGGRSKTLTVEIPGFGTVNLKKALDTFFPAGKGVSKVTHKFDDLQMQDTSSYTTRSSYGSHASCGNSEYKRSIASLPLASVAAPVDKFDLVPQTFAASQVEDIGL